MKNYVLILRPRASSLSCFHTFLCCLHYSSFTTWFGLFWADMCLSPCHHSIITDYWLELCPALELNKVHIIWWSYLRDFSLEYLLTYKKRIHFFWKSSIAVAGNQTQIAQTKVRFVDHYTIIAWMKIGGSMDHFMPHKLLVLMIFGQQPHNGLWPLTSSFLQNYIGK